MVNDRLRDVDTRQGSWIIDLRTTRRSTDSKTELLGESSGVRLRTESEVEDQVSGSRGV